MTYNITVSDLEQIAAAWRKRAGERRDVSKIDPAADALEFCATELEESAHAAEQEPAPLTVEQYAKLPHVDVTPQTVRGWIRSGRLQAQDTVKGYRIAPDAVVLKPPIQR